MSLNTSGWKDYVFGDLIPEDGIYKAKAYVDEDLQSVQYYTDGVIPYVTRTDMDNGVKSLVSFRGIHDYEEGNAITIGDTTSTVSYHESPFVCGDHMVVIRAPWLNLYTGLFIVALLQKERFRYSYGRAFKMDAIRSTLVRLPADKKGNPNWTAMEEYIQSLKHKVITTQNKRTTAYSFDVSKWKKFTLSEFFEVKKGKRLTADDQTDGNTLYIGAIDSNNGVANKIGQKPIHSGNTISLSYNGSVGQAFYQPDPYWATDDVNALYFKESNGVKFNQYIALFIATILKKEQYRFSYGRKWIKEEMENTVLRLPVDQQGKPDWKFMEEYIQSLPYGDRI